jgi:hypothetical protein
METTIMHEHAIQTAAVGGSISSADDPGELPSHLRLDALPTDIWPDSARSIGSLDLLALHTLGIVCSVRLPGSIILETFDFSKAVSSEGIAVVGGFHSPMERQCLEILLVRHVPVVICLGRRLSTGRVPSEWRVPLIEERLMLMSPFDEKKKRVDRDLAYQRNRLVMGLSDTLLVPYAAPGGKAEKIVREALVWKKPVWSFGVEEGEELFALGVRPTTARGVVEMLGEEGSDP